MTRGRIALLRCTLIAPLLGAFGLAAAELAPVAATPAPAGDSVVAWVDQKVAACEPKATERRFDQTGWLTNIRSALDLAARHNRPVFLFTHDGHMGVGRC